MVIDEVFFPNSQILFLTFQWISKRKYFKPTMSYSFQHIVCKNYNFQYKNNEIQKANESVLFKKLFWFPDGVQIISLFHKRRNIFKLK